MKRSHGVSTSVACVLACALFGACSTSSSDDATSGGGGKSSTGGSAAGGKVGGSAGSGSAGAAGDASAGAGGARDCEVDTTYMPKIEAADFVAEVDNPYWPLVPGTSWVFEGGGEYVEVSVLEKTKVILGIDAVVVRDTVRAGAADADIVEDTYDWYAQDKTGNVWYLGEDTQEYEDGVVVSTAGSWVAGVDGAQPGIVAYAVPPAAGKPYRQEYLGCEAEDFAETVSVSESVSVPFGDFDDCIQTHEFTPLEPSVNEYKYYCAGVGLVLEVDVATGDRVELTEMTGP